MVKECRRSAPFFGLSHVPKGTRLLSISESARHVTARMHESEEEDDASEEKASSPKEQTEKEIG